MPPVDEWSFHRDEVHPVEDRVDEQRVVQAVGRDRPRVVLLGAHLQRRPTLAPMLGVEGLRQLQAALRVDLVLGELHPRTWEQREEADASTPVGVVLEERVVGLEAAQDVLRELEPVHTQEQLRVAPPRAQLLAERLHLRRGGRTSQRRRVERDRVRADEDPAAVDVDPTRSDVDVHVVQGVPHAQQEALDPRIGLEAEDVGTEHAAEQVLAHRLREQGGRYVGPANGVCVKCAICALGWSCRKNPGTMASW